MDVAQYCTCGSILLPPIPLPASLFCLSSYGVGCSSFVPYAPAPDHHLRPAMSRRMLPGSSVHRPLNWTPSQTAHHPGGSSSKVSEAQTIWEGSILSKASLSFDVYVYPKAPLMRASLAKNGAINTLFAHKMSTSAGPNALYACVPEPFALPPIPVPRLEDSAAGEW
jgi:hypothetical protein